jgi:hypothetical protein
MKKCAQYHAEESGLIKTVDFWTDTRKRTAIRKGKHAMNLEEVIPDVKAQFFFKYLFTDKWDVPGCLI